MASPTKVLAAKLVIVGIHAGRRWRGHVLAGAGGGGARAIDLRGKNVLITGGSRGLGLVLARHLAERGANLVICARVEEGLDRAVDDLGMRTRVLGFPCDISHRGQVEEMVQVVLQRWGLIDVLINNAGVISEGPMEGHGDPFLGARCTRP